MQPHELKRVIREIPDYPKPGINFYDVSTLFRNGPALRSVVSQMVQPFRESGVDGVVGIEARGFVLASAMALELDCGMVMARKKGKLPAETTSEGYELEYGAAEVELHTDAIQPGERLLIVDDVLATGGTAAAVGRLVRRLEGENLGYSFMVELGFLDGRVRLDGAPVFSVLCYE